MPKRKADSSDTPVQCKTHLGFKEMASEEDWQLIHSKTQQMLISNAQQLYKGQAEGGGTSGAENGASALCVSPVQEGEEDPGYKQSSLLDHFKLTSPHKEHKHTIVSQDTAGQQSCTRCLRSSLPRFSPCSFCERVFCPNCVGRCSGCGKSFCPVCSQIDYSDSVEEKLLCLSCFAENN